MKFSELPYKKVPALSFIHIGQHDTSNLQDYYHLSWWKICRR